jgi:dUTP pyrophosphatase
MLPRFSVASTKRCKDAGSPGNGDYRDDQGRGSTPRDRGREAGLYRWMGHEGAGPVIELEIRRTRADARVPERAYDGDAGLDLAACDEVRLGPGERALVGTGLAVAIPEGYAGFVQPRSGLAARHGIAVVNSPGLIDSGYRGEIKVVLLNTDREKTFAAEPGERIAQLVVLPVPELAVREVDELPESVRGVRGFGSSQGA